MGKLWLSTMPVEHAPNHLDPAHCIKCTCAFNILDKEAGTCVKASHMMREDNVLTSYARLTLGIKHEAVIWLLSSWSEGKTKKTKTTHVYRSVIDVVRSFEGVDELLVYQRYSDIFGFRHCSMSGE